MTTGNDRPTKIGKDCKRERWGIGGAGVGGVRERATEAKQGNDETRIQTGKY